MNGPEHYAEAERLARAADTHMRRLSAMIDAPFPPVRADVDTQIASMVSVTSLAQVHATLALTAAEAGGRVTVPGDGRDFDEDSRYTEPTDGRWAEVIG